MSKQDNHKSFKITPLNFWDVKTGEILDYGEQCQQLVDDVTMIAQMTDFQLKSDGWNLLEEIKQYNALKPAEAGRRLGLTLPLEMLSGFKSGKTRYERLFRDQVVRLTRSWRARWEVTMGVYDGYVSQGWRKTANPNRPQNLSPKYSLSAVDSQFAKIVNSPFDDKFIQLHMIIGGQWCGLTFHLPKRYRGANKISLPDITINNNTPVFIFSAAYKYNYSELNARYLVGLDVGIANYGAVIVWDVEQQQVVFESLLSRRVHHLSKSVSATCRQIVQLRKQQEQLQPRTEQYEKLAEDIRLQRAANVRKRHELAIVAGQEVADIASNWGNCAVMVEDLSWVDNTMEHGRWNRGAFVQWLTHYVELNGSRVLTVNCAGTSQECSHCRAKVSHIDSRTVHCPQCGRGMDRDLNAAANIAQNGEQVLAKSVKTRENDKHFTHKTVKRSPAAHDSLKHPGVKPVGKCKKIKGIDRTKHQPTVHYVRKTVDMKPYDEVVCVGEGVNDSMCSPVHIDDGASVTGDGKLRTRTLKRQHDSTCNGKTKPTGL